MAAVGVSGAVVAVSPRHSSALAFSPGEGECQPSSNSNSVSLFFGQKCGGFVLSGELRRRRRLGATFVSSAYATDADHIRENFTASNSEHISGKTLYDYLGVSQLATPEQIKTAYRSKALKVHPDVVPEERREEATNAFLELKMAYVILHDRQQRAAYDLKLRFRERGSMSVTPSQWGFISVPPSPDDPAGAIKFRGRKNYESDFFS